MGYTGNWIYIGQPTGNHVIPDRGTNFPSVSDANRIAGFASGYPDYNGYDGPDFTTDNNDLSMVEVSWTTHRNRGEDGAYVTNNKNGWPPSQGTYTVDGETRTSTMVYTGNHHVTYRMSDGTLIQDKVSIVYYANGDVFIRPSKTQDTDNIDWGDRQIVGVTMGQNIPRDGYKSGYDAFIGPRSFEYDETSPPVICFARGTMIETETGPVAVEQLKIGTLVHTRDSGLQPIRWIGSRKLGAATLQANSNLRPIRIKAGALGTAAPETDLLVSPQHRILVSSKIAQRMFSSDEVLVAAKQLLALEGIGIAEDLPEVEYFHFLFDQHEIVISNGVESESLYTGTQALKSVSATALAEIYAIFPDLQTRDQVNQTEAARMLLTGRQGRKLVQRHAENLQPLVASAV